MKVIPSISKRLVGQRHKETSNNAAERFFSRISAEVRARAPPPPPPPPPMLSAISFNVDSGVYHTESNNNEALMASCNRRTPSTGEQADQLTD
ncbi:unnamed protein product [Taenia asiatica]|uniref:Uncharacterized protein n=1 Tax=Taenia asiatica TaxID=60517 RepID=A0A0R3VWB4_TAEAS|nr:unnamed protein product [Taenia asiatica]